MKNKILLIALVILLSVMSGCQKIPAENDAVLTPPSGEVEKLCFFQV